jgi:chemotaxis family two-component system response regulator Rcp1
MGRRLTPVNILLVEDNPNDVEMTVRALKAGPVRLTNNLTIARDGQEALDALFSHRNGGVPKPSLILLDLNLPKVDGREVLEKIKADRKLKRIPVVVLTVSSREEDVARCYDLGVNTFITKPVRFEDFVEVVKVIKQYWIIAGTLPQAQIGG